MRLSKEGLPAKPVKEMLISVDGLIIYGVIDEIILYSIIEKRGLCIARH